MTKNNAQSCKKHKSNSTRSPRHDNQPIHHFQMQLKRALYKPLCVWLTPNCKLLHIASKSVSYGPFFRVLSSIGPIRIHICSHSHTPLVLWPTTPPNSLGKLKKQPSKSNFATPVSVLKPLLLFSEFPALCKHFLSSPFSCSQPSAPLL